MRSSLCAAAAFGVHSIPFVNLFAGTESISTDRRRATLIGSDNAFSARWIGHSTILINAYGTIILCDPVFSGDVGVQFLGQTVGIRRLSEPSLRLEDVPRPDYVLLSHAHMDHTDLPSLEALCAKYPDQIRCICAKNTKDIVDDLAWKHCRELDWWDSTSFGPIRITATEVLHNGWRYPWEADRREGARDFGRSYNAYLISCGSTNVVFGGDTAYTESFRELRNVSIATAFMPIGAYAGCSDNHCTPEESLRMVEAMRAQTLAPIHCMTFRQTPEPYAEPMKRLEKSLQHSDVRLAWDSIGSLIEISNKPLIAEDRSDN